MVLRNNIHLLDWNCCLCQLFVLENYAYLSHEIGGSIQHVDINVCSHHYFSEGHWLDWIDLCCWTLRASRKAWALGALRLRRKVATSFTVESYRDTVITKASTDRDILLVSCKVLFFYSRFESWDRRSLASCLAALVFLFFQLIR